MFGIKITSPLQGLKIYGESITQGVALGYYNYALSEQRKSILNKDNKMCKAK